MEYPKSTSTQDASSKKKRKSRLVTIRRKTHNEVKERERGRCGVCKWNPGSDMHHVYGRGRQPTDWKESSQGCMWVCRLCHPTGHLNVVGETEIELALRECIAGTRFTWEPYIG